MILWREAKSNEARADQKTSTIMMVNGWYHIIFSISAFSFLSQRKGSREGKGEKEEHKLCVHFFLSPYAVQQKSSTLCRVYSPLAVDDDDDDVDDDGKRRFPFQNLFLLIIIAIVSCFSPFCNGSNGR